MTAEFDRRGHFWQVAKKIAIAPDAALERFEERRGRLVGKLMRLVNVDLSAISGMKALARRPLPDLSLRAD